MATSGPPAKQSLTNYHPNINSTNDQPESYLHFKSDLLYLCGLFLAMTFVNILKLNSNCHILNIL